MQHKQRQRRESAQTTAPCRVTTTRVPDESAYTLSYALHPLCHRTRTRARAHATTTTNTQRHGNVNRDDDDTPLLTVGEAVRLSTRVSVAAPSAVRTRPQTATHRVWTTTMQQQQQQQQQQNDDNSGAAAAAVVLDVQHTLRPLSAPQQCDMRLRTPLTFAQQQQQQKQQQQQQSASDKQADDGGHKTIADGDAAERRLLRALQEVRKHSVDNAYAHASSNNNMAARAGWCAPLSARSLQHTRPSTAATSSRSLRATSTTTSSSSHNNNTHTSRCVVEHKKGDDSLHDYHACLPHSSRRQTTTAATVPRCTRAASAPRHGDSNSRAVLLHDTYAVLDHYALQRRDGQLRHEVQHAAQLPSLSYAARVFVAAVLYTRALGGLPTLLHAGPVAASTATSLRLVRARDCVELCFTSPTHAAAALHSERNNNNGGNGDADEGGLVGNRAAGNDSDEGASSPSSPWLSLPRRRSTLAAVAQSSPLLWRRASVASDTSDAAAATADIAATTAASARSSGDNNGSSRRGSITEDALRQTLQFMRYNRGSLATAMTPAPTPAATAATAAADVVAGEETPQPREHDTTPTTRHRSRDSRQPSVSFAFGRSYSDSQNNNNSNRSAAATPRTRDAMAHTRHTRRDGTPRSRSLTTTAMPRATHAARPAALHGTTATAAVTPPPAQPSSNNNNDKKSMHALLQTMHAAADAAEVHALPATLRSLAYGGGGGTSLSALHNDHQGRGGADEQRDGGSNDDGGDDDTSARADAHVLRVIVRVVMARKTTITCFGKTDVVHVLPALPHVPDDDDNNNSAATASQQQQQQQQPQQPPSLPFSSLLTPPLLLPHDAVHRLLTGSTAMTDARTRTQRNSNNNTSNKSTTTTAAAATAWQQQCNAVYGDVAVALLLSGDASQLTGALPDATELSQLRFRFFRLPTQRNDTTATTTTAAAAAPVTQSRDAARGALLPLYRELSVSERTLRAHTRRRTSCNTQHTQQPQGRRQRRAHSSRAAAPTTAAGVVCDECGLTRCDSSSDDDEEAAWQCAAMCSGHDKRNNNNDGGDEEEDSEGERALLPFHVLHLRSFCVQLCSAVDSVLRARHAAVA